MPQNQIIKIKHPKTGEIISFKWDKSTPPTDADLDEMASSLEDITTPEVTKPISNQPNLFSRLGETASGLKDFAINVARAGMNDPAAQQEIGMGAIRPFGELVKNRTTNNSVIGPGGIVPNIGENISRFATGMFGADYNTLDEDVQAGRYGAALGDVAIPAALAFGPHIIKGAGGLIDRVPVKSGGILSEIGDISGKSESFTPPPRALLEAPKPRPNFITTPEGVTVPLPDEFDFLNRNANEPSTSVSPFDIPSRRLTGEVAELSPNQPSRGNYFFPTDLPSVRGRGDLSFGETNPAVSLGYPLDIVPNRLRPRSMQTVEESLAGNRTAQIEPILEPRTVTLDTSTIKPRAVDPFFSPEQPSAPIRPLGSRISEIPTKLESQIENVSFEEPNEPALNRSRPETKDYVPKVLNSAGKGKPGLSSQIEQSKFKSLGNKELLVYRSNDGKPIAVARLLQDGNGNWMVEDFAADKSKGLLYGRAVKNIGEELRRRGITTPAGTVTPDALNLMNKGLSKTELSSKPGELVPEDFSLLHSGVNPSEFFKMLRDKLGSRPRIPYSGKFVSPELLSKPQGDIIKFLQNVKPLAAQQKELRTGVRAEQAAKMGQVTEKGEKGSYIRRGILKGELPKVGFEPIRNKFTPEQISQFHDQINFSKLGEFDKVNAVKGLDKILDESGSTLPVPSEMRQLAKVFGQDFTNSVLELHAGIPLPVLNANLVLDIINIPKSATTGLDVSFPFRQGAALMHQPSFKTSIGPMLESFKSETAAKAYDTALKTDPLYELFDPNNPKGINIGLTEVSSMFDDPILRDEHQASAAAHKILPYTKWSERSFNVFGNRLRFDTMKAILTEAKKAGIELNKENVEKFAKYVRNASGRGNLPSFEMVGHGKTVRVDLNSIAPILNAVGFSPRFITSRFHMLNPKNYLMHAGPKLLKDGTANPQYAMNKLLRKQYLRSALSMTKLYTAMAALPLAYAYATGQDADIELSPLSTDFLKTRVGNTRIDSMAGLQQPFVRTMQFLAGEQKKIGADEDTAFEFGGRTTPLARFTRSKLSPTAAFVWDLLEGRDYLGNKFQADARTMNLFLPMIANDLYELSKEDPGLAAILAIPKLGGVGGQTFNQTNIGQDFFGRKMER